MYYFKKKQKQCSNYLQPLRKRTNLILRFPPEELEAETTKSALYRMQTAAKEQSF